VLPDAGEVGGAAEEKDGDEREEVWASGGRRRGGGDVQLGGRAGDTHGRLCLSASLPHVRDRHATHDSQSGRDTRALSR
jgi:hypothetical protein